MDTEPSLTSCIIPVFNGEQYLREALDSVFAQTYRPLEVIVADDGSTDDTGRIVATYGEPISYKKQLNQGAVVARNLGLSVARGEYIAFLDADDLWHPEKLERQVMRLRANPDVAGCVTHIVNFWSPDLRPDEIPTHDQRILSPVPGYAPPTLLARRTLFDAIGDFNTDWKHADATEWFLRAQEHGATIELLPDVWVYRRLHQSNLSRRMASDSRAEYLQLLKNKLDRRRSRLRS